MATTHEKKLRDLAKLAEEVAELIQQNGDSPTGPGGGMQQHVLRDTRSHGPDPHLQAVEDRARDLVKAIRTYLAKVD